MSESGIIKDYVSKDNFGKYAVSCEDCTHFDLATEVCTFGYPTEPCLRRNQAKDLEALGKIAFCRAMEID